MYDVTAASASAVQQVDTNDPNLKQKYDAFEFNLNARLPGGARLFGGTATDRTIANTCSAAANNPNFLLTVGGVNQLLRSIAQRHPRAHSSSWLARSRCRGTV